MVELGAAVVCMTVLISPMVRPSEFSPILSWSERSGEALGVCMCMYCTGSCIQTGGALYLSFRYFYSSSNNCTCTRSMGGPFVRIIDQKEQRDLKGSSRDDPDEIHHVGLSLVCPGSRLGSKTFTFQSCRRRLGKRSA